MSVQLTTTSIENYNPNNVKDNYNIINFKTNYTPTGSVNTHKVGNVDFYNKAQNGTEMLSASISGSAVTTSSIQTVILGKLKLESNSISSSSGFLDSSFLEIFVNSISTLKGNGGIAIRAGSTSNAGKTISLYADDGDYRYQYITTTTTRWYPDGVTNTASLNTTGLALGTTSPTAMLDVNSTKIRLRTADTPASATATGNQGDICWDANYIYVCVATNTWKRSALASW